MECATRSRDDSCAQVPSIAVFCRYIVRKQKPTRFPEFPGTVRSGGSMPAWWVNQGSTYAQERKGGYVWAPTKTKAGRPVEHHTNVSRLQPGDAIVHYAGGSIRSVGVVR